jgi:YidC/Oxa1 family membrane protein insertase
MPAITWDNLIITPFVNILMAIYYFIGQNFGLAIILFTIVVRLLTQPLTAKQIKSSQAMQDLQRNPKWIETQKKYKGEKEKLAQEQMKIYKELGISPFSSCLPLLIQLPIIIALYQTLRQAMASNPLDLFTLSKHIWANVSVQGLIIVGVIILLVVAYFVIKPRIQKPPKYSWLVLVAAIAAAYFIITITKLGAGVSFKGLDISNLIPINTQFLGMWDLAKRDSVPIFGLGVPIMTIIVVITTYIQQKVMAPPANAPKDQSSQMMGMMNIYMPLLMGWIALTLESGLALYFIVSNVVGIAQYAIMGKVNWGNLVPFRKPQPVKVAEKGSKKVIDGEIITNAKKTADKKPELEAKGSADENTDKENK